jgi:hypothetical protein
MMLLGQENIRDGILFPQLNEIAAVDRLTTSTAPLI